MRTLLAAALIILCLLGVLGLMLWNRSRLQDAINQKDTLIAELTTAIETQNTAIRDLQTQSDMFESEAAAAVRTILRDGERRRRQLPAGHGPAVMNTWLRETFRRAPDAPAP